MSHDLADFYSMLGYYRAAGFLDAESRADEALLREGKGTTMTNQEAIIRTAWEELKRLGLIESTGEYRAGMPIYNFSRKGKQLIDAVLAHRPRLQGTDFEDAIAAEIEHIRGTLS